MKGEYIKIFTLLIALFYINILEINNIRRANKKRNNIINNDEDYARFLKEDYTEGREDSDDKKSIENCQNSDEDYFDILAHGKSFTFNKYVDERDAVNHKYI
jgi:hypothetical protein